MKIIEIFNPYLEKGGEENAADRIRDDLRSGGHEVHSFRRPTSDWSQPDGPPKWRQPLLMWNNSTILAQLESLTRQTNADLWILHNIIPVISLGVYKLAKRLDIPTLQWLHNYRPISPGGSLRAGAQSLEPTDRHIYFKESLAGSWRNRPLTAWLSFAYAAHKRLGAFDQVSGWVAVSETMKQVFNDAGWYPDRLHALRHSTDLRLQAPQAQDKGYFLFMSRLIPEKGVEFLTQLFSRPELRDHRLVIAGSGPERERLERAAPPNIEWRGFVSGKEKQRLLEDCRAVLFPAQWSEPLGIVVYEAFNARKPVLASQLGGLNETVSNNATGRLLAPNDPNAWSQALLQLNPPLAQEWGANGFNWLQANASTTQWLQGFHQIVQQLPHPKLSETYC